MIIVIWIIAIMGLALIIGEIKYRFEYRKGGSVNQNIFMRSWNDSIDRDIDALLMEQLDDDFVSSKVLSMRGSWRLAHNQVMDAKLFESMLIDEYSRKL